MSRFGEFVAKVEAVPFGLPLTHSTDAYHLRAIIDRWQLEPEHCPVFTPERLLYFFYGRPAYRQREVQPSGLMSVAPVALVLRPPTSFQVRRVLPFDSGAFGAGLYEGVLHKNMQLADFMLEPDMNSAEKLIALFYGDSAAYLTAAPKTDVVVPPFEFEAESYYQLISDKTRNSYDDRACAIEIQSSQPLPLADNLEAIALPASFLDDVVFAAKLEASGVKPLPYSYVSRMRPSEQLGRIYSLVEQYLAAEQVGT
jgi:hypothetical protein